VDEDVRQPRPADDELDRAADAPGEAVDLVVTGHPAVDEVIRSLQGLEARPVSEHVAVFEVAHESLRGVLSGAGEPGSGEPGSAGR
jgi:hypothetical protein